MATYLLDVNALVALAWPSHTHHSVAERWFTSGVVERWATCPMTQCGLVRISSNPKAVAAALTPGGAIELLRGMTAHPRHQFWEETSGLVDLGGEVFDRVTGYRQVSDAYLLGLCLDRGGKLATFDRGILALAKTDAERDAIEVIVG